MFDEICVYLRYLRYLRFLRVMRLCLCASVVQKRRHPHQSYIPSANQSPVLRSR